LGAEQLDPLIDGAKVHLFTVARSMTRRPNNTYVHPPLKSNLKSISLAPLWPLVSLVFQFHPKVIYRIQLKCPPRRRHRPLLGMPTWDPRVRFPFRSKKNCPAMR